MTDIADNMRLPERDRAMAKLLIEACRDWPEFNLEYPCELVSTLKMESMASIFAFMQCSIHPGLPDDMPQDDAIKHCRKRCVYG